MNNTISSALLWLFVLDSVIKQSNQQKFRLMEIYKDKHSLGGELHYIVYEADLIIIEE